MRVAGGAAWSIARWLSDARRRPLHHLGGFWSSFVMTAGLAVLPQHAAGASPGAHVPEGRGTGIDDIGCRLAFKDGVRCCNAITVLPQLATWRVDMVLVAHNLF